MTAAAPVFTGLDAVTLGYAVVVVFVAAFVRGYSGFGSSALIITGLSLVLPPAEIVPIALLMEIAASIGLLPQIWKDVPWRMLGLLLAGAAAGMPAGFAMLAAFPVDVMRAVVGGLVLTASVLLWAGVRFRGDPRTPHILGTGLVSGVANGVAAVGGLPVVLFLLSSTAGVVMSRATLIVYLMVADIYAVGVAAANDLMAIEVFERSALFLVPLFLGVWLGNRHFLATSPESFRRFALLLLMGLSIAVLLRAGLG